MLLLRQGENGWLLTADGGNHEFSKARYEKGGYKLRDPNPRLGPHTLEHIAIDADGALFTWSGGRKSWLPRDWYQATWVTP